MTDVVLMDMELSSTFTFKKLESVIYQLLRLKRCFLHEAGIILL